MSESQAEGGRASKRFDPVAGMRAMADIQAEGLRAAGELLERVIGSEPKGHEPRAAKPAEDYSALVDAWSDLLRRTLSGLSAPGHPGSVTVPVDANGAGPAVRLRAGGTVEVWLHNGATTAAGPLALRCGPLARADGAVLDGTRVQFEPVEVESLPPRSSRAVTVSVAAAGELEPGSYRGAIQAAGAPALWLPFEITVEPC